MISRQNIANRKKKTTMKRRLIVKKQQMWISLTLNLQIWQIWNHLNMQVCLLIRRLTIFFEEALSIEWPSCWVEPELGRSILGLGRIEHISSVRKDWAGSDSCSTSEIEQALLIERIDRIRILVRRIESNRHTCSSSTQLEFRLIQKSRIEWSILELNNQIRFTSWAEQAILFDDLIWVINLVRARALS
jgi:hypothetical protein